MSYGQPPQELSARKFSGYDDFWDMDPRWEKIIERIKHYMAFNEDWDRFIIHQTPDGRYTAVRYGWGSQIAMPPSLEPDGHCLNIWTRYKLGQFIPE